MATGSSTCLELALVCHKPAVTVPPLLLLLLCGLLLLCLQPAARLITPTHRSVNLEESRSAFLGSLSSYAKNAVKGHYGDFTVRSAGGLAALAGY